MSYTLSNVFLDKLKIDEYPIYLKSLRTHGLGLTRQQLSVKIGVSVYSIRKYESYWSKSQPPDWYELLLRLMAGDLSYFGNRWTNCRLFPHNQALSIPHLAPHTAFYPEDIHLRYNQIYLMSQQQKTELRIEVTKTEAVNSALKADNASMSLKIEQLEAKIKRLQNVNQSIKSGKIIPLFAER